jgi:glyoxylase-like metal-dependent hydrolase (beta-lactamase superfamily II)
MKMKTSIRALAFLFAAVWICPALAQQQEAPPVRLSKLSDRLYEVLDGRGARGAAYVGDNAVLLVDSKMDKKSVDQTLEAVKSITPLPVRYLVNTHSDGDHVAGNRYLPETVLFVSHENCRNEFFLPGRDGKPSEWTSPDLARFVPSITYREKMDLYLGAKKVELWHFGVGHTTGDTVVYFPEEKVAFLGDQLFLARPQLIHAYKGGNPLEHVATLERMLAVLDVVTYCSGHSEPTDRNGVLGHVSEMKARLEKVRKLMDEGKDLDEIKRAFNNNEAALVETIYIQLSRRAP